MKLESNREKFKDLTLDELAFNVKERHKLIDQMVGSLYPGILHDEICILNSLISDKTHGRR